MLAREDVPDTVLRAYGLNELSFGRDYLIPKPFDPRVLLWVAPAVATAAAASGVARHPITDVEAYRDRLAVLVERSRGLHAHRLGSGGDVRRVDLDQFAPRLCVELDPAGVLERVHMKERVGDGPPHHQQAMVAQHHEVGLTEVRLQPRLLGIAKRNSFIVMVGQ